MKRIVIILALFGLAACGGDGAGGGEGDSTATECAG
jgi:ABC-type glycerol-3-phosphate transport system substrate-binding protein